MRITIVWLLIFISNLTAWAQPQIKVDGGSWSWLADLPWWAWLFLIPIIMLLGVIIRGKVFIDFLLKIFRIKNGNGDGKVKGNDVEISTNGKHNLNEELKDIHARLESQDVTLEAQDITMAKQTDTLAEQDRMLHEIKGQITTLSDDHARQRSGRGEYEAVMKATVEGVKDLVSNELSDLKVDEKKTATNVERLIEKTVELIAEVKARR